ncbi:MAG: hypothetical protein ABIY50_02475 [Ignavibacteria bacterium]
MIILNFYNSYPIAKEDINRVPVEILKIRDNVKQKYDERLSGSTVMARKPHISYYLNMQFVAMPFSENYEEFIQNLKFSKANYVFVSENEGLISSNENLKNLLSADSPPKELEVITSTDNPVTVLYKVK